MFVSHLWCPGTMEWGAGYMGPFSLSLSGCWVGVDLGRF